jgi:hypothetical protein
VTLRRITASRARVAGNRGRTESPTPPGPKLPPRPSV